MKAEALALIAEGIEKGLNMGYNFLGLDAPDSLFRELRDCADRYGFYDNLAIFRRLYDLNARAYSGRYPYDPADPTPPEMPVLPPLLHHVEWDGEKHLLTVEHFKYFKMLDCFIYQCAEDATCKDPLFLAVKDWHKDWMRFLIRNNPTFAALPWGGL